jgi:hypothetical protein
VDFREMFLKFRIQLEFELVSRATLSKPSAEKLTGVVIEATM